MVIGAPSSEPAHGLVDLHTHTTCSDGTLSPSALVRMAREVGLQTLAITDHDSVDAIAAAAAESKSQGIELVPGVELSSEMEGRELHLLGYFVDAKDAAFVARLAELAGLRESRIRRIVERLSDLGIDLEFRRVRELAGNGSIGRPHVARALIERKDVATVSEAFDRYLSRSGAAFVPRAKFAPEDAVALVLQAGGVPVLAHPLTTGDPEGVVQWLLPAGLRGIEVYYSEYDLATRNALREVADRHGLIPTGGSDFHGPNFRPGRDLGGPIVPPDAVARLREAASASRTHV